MFLLLYSNPTSFQTFLCNFQTVGKHQCLSQHCQNKLLWFYCSSNITLSWILQFSSKRTDISCSVTLRKSENEIFHSFSFFSVTFYNPRLFKLHSGPTLRLFPLTASVIVRQAPGKSSSLGLGLLLNFTLRCAESICKVWEWQQQSFTPRRSRGQCVMITFLQSDTFHALLSLFIFVIPRVQPWILTMFSCILSYLKCLVSPTL